MLLNITSCLIPTNLKCIFFPNKGSAGRLRTQRPVFYINNNSAVEYVEQWPHLGHVISSDLDDKHDINRYRSALVRPILSCASLEHLIVYQNEIAHIILL